MKTSLRKKLIIFLLAATILPISISMFITYQYTTSSISDQAVQDNSKLLFQGKTNLKNYFDLFNKLSLSVYNDNSSGQTTLFKIVRDGVPSSDDGYIKEIEITKYLRSMAKTNPDIFQIRLDVDKDNRTYLLVNELVRSGTIFRTPSDDAVNRNPSGYMESSHLSHTYGINERTKFLYYIPKTVITLHRPILDIPSDKQIGFISIDITLDFIRSIGEMLYTGGSEELWIFDGQDKVVYSSDERKIGGALHESWASQVTGKEQARGQYRLKSESFDGIVMYEKLSMSYMDWTIVKRIPYNQLYESTRRLTMINSLVLGCFLLVSAVATIYISYKITKPIKRLINSINLMQSGNLQVDIPIDSKDEIGVFSRLFRQLMDQINHLILREYRLELANKTNQLKALQAQIHPHFLNNALQSIGTVALHNQDRKVYTLISSLGKLMRYHMNTEETVVPLFKEIDHVQAYAELQKQRFGEMLEVRFEVAPNVENLEVPKMIVQPLVENVFKHGVKRADMPIVITVRCSRPSESVLELQVSDNGSGIENELMAKLQAQLDQSDIAASSPKEDNIGLANVLMRLQLFFNEYATMNLQPNEGGGLIVTITIPIAKAEGGTAV